MARSNNFSNFFILSTFFFVLPVICDNDFISLLFDSGWQNRSIAQMARQLRIKIYQGSSMETASSWDIPIQDTEVIYGHINSSKPVVIYIHGYLEHPSNESVRTIVEAHLKRGSDNIMLLDWSDLAFGNYVMVASNVRGIATILTLTFDKLVRRGINLESFHIIGHSIGAQIAGFVGKYSVYSIPRITGLDPAKPLFYYPGAKHIDASDARFVDIIHTDGGIYGASSSTGTVDFIANTGTRPQPGCPLFGTPLGPEDLCSHWRSWRYYAESVLHEFSFPAVKCSSFTDFVTNKCSKNSVAYVGYATLNTLRGTYYFTTSHRSPFGRVARFYLPVKIA